MITSTAYDKYIRQVRLAQHIPQIACDIIRMEEMGNDCECYNLKLQTMIVDLGIISAQLKGFPLLENNDTLYNNALTENELQFIYESVFDETDCILPPLGTNGFIPDEAYSPETDKVLIQFIGGEETGTAIHLEEGNFILLENVIY